MITTAVSCPNPPLLLPGLAGGPITEVEALRSACVDAVRQLADVDVVVAVGGAPDTGRYEGELPAPTSRFAPSAGRPNPSPVLPLSLAVGRDLLGRAELGRPVELWGIAHDADRDACAQLGARLAARPERVGLLVLADGSARRGEKAPGYLDPRAAPFDAELERALRTGDARALLELDRALADALLVAGRPAWQVLGAAWVGRPAAAELSYSDDPFGVWYPVATWRRPRG